jgi:hypothetical protein
MLAGVGDGGEEGGRRTRRMDGVLRLVLRVRCRRTYIVSLMLDEGAPFLAELVFESTAREPSQCCISQTEVYLNWRVDPQYL